MAANVDVNAYMQPEPQHWARLQMGFTPSPTLDTALRGFLLPESSTTREGQQVARSRAVGDIVLRSFARRIFPYTHGDSGIRYVDEAMLTEEQKRLERLQNDMVAVVDLTMALTDNNTMVMALRLHPTVLQRKKLSGPILGNLSKQAKPDINVYKTFDAQDIHQDRNDLIRCAISLRRALHEAREPNDSRDDSSVASMYFVRAPRIIPADVASPKITW